MILKELLEIINSKLTTNDIHNLADKLGINWDNDKKFMRFTKKITGVEHLDDLNQDQFKLIYKALESGKFNDE